MTCTKSYWFTYEFPDKENCYYLQCSNCGKITIWNNEISYLYPNYCPNCGAKMKNAGKMRVEE